MYTRVFNVKIAPKSTQYESQNIKVPGLKCYALTGKAELLVNGVTYFEGDEFVLDWDNEIIKWLYEENSFDLEGNDEVKLRIPHRGVMNPTDLFKWISDENLRTCTSGYYEEMLKCLEVEAWIAATTLAGATLESVLTGILKSSTGIGNFKGKIDKAVEEKIILEKDKAFAHEIREYRNRIHTNLANEKGLPSRALALRTATLLERIIDLSNQDMS